MEIGTDASAIIINVCQCFSRNISVLTFLEIHTWIENRNVLTHREKFMTFYLKF